MVHNPFKGWAEHRYVQLVQLKALLCTMYHALCTLNQALFIPLKITYYLAFGFGFFLG